MSELPLPEEARDFDPEVEVSSVPTYDPADQFTVEQLKIEYPDWAGHYEGDAELSTIGYERTRAMRKIGQRMGIGSTVFTVGGLGLNWAIEHTSPLVGSKFQAHGFGAKGDPVTEIDNILRRGINEEQHFYTMPFSIQIEGTEAFGAEKPVTVGGIISLSEYDTHPTQPNIAYIIVGEEYNRVIDLLRKRYPKVTIIPWHDAPRLLTEIVNKQTGGEIPYVTLTKENEPGYKRPAGLGFAKLSFTDLPTAEPGEFIEGDFHKGSSPGSAKDEDIW